MSIIVHHLERSRSHRILWLLEELGQTYELRRYARHRKTMRAGEDLKRVHPLGKSPVITLDGQVYAESGAIVQTLVVRFDDGTLRPEPGTEAHRHYRYFLHYAEGSLMTPLIVGLITRELRKAPLPLGLRLLPRLVARGIDEQFTKGELRAHGAFLEGHLAEHAHFAGEAFSAVDVQMSYGVEALLRFEARPRLQAWMERMRARPAYRKAIDVGGPTMPG